MTKEITKMQETNKHDEPICDECKLLQPSIEEMHEIDMGNEPDVWICDECHRIMMNALSYF
jgi:uncharacterized protein with PIN domain